MSDDLLPGEPEVLTDEERAAAGSPEPGDPELPAAEFDPFKARWPDSWESQPRMIGRTEFVVNVLADRLAQRMEVVPDGQFAGMHVITRRGAYEALSEEFPPVSAQSAELVTPARIYVEATCPQCDIPVSTAGYIKADLHVDYEAGEVKIKLKTKPVPHLCGQLVLPVKGPEVEGQTDIESVVSETVVTDEQEESVAGLDAALADIAGLDDLELPPAPEPKPKRGRRKVASE